MPRSNTYERPRLRSASYGYYLTSPGFLIMPIEATPPHGGSWAIGPGQHALESVPHRSIYGIGVISSGPLQERASIEQVDEHHSQDDNN